MAITVAKSPENYLVSQSDGTVKVAYGVIAGPASYSTGGFAADVATDFGISAPTYVKVFADNGMTAVWDSTAKKVKAFKSVGTEADAATNLSAVNYFLIILYSD